MKTKSLFLTLIILMLPVVSLALRDSDTGLVYEQHGSVKVVTLQQNYHELIKVNGDIYGKHGSLTYRLNTKGERIGGGYQYMGKIDGKGLEALDLIPTYFIKLPQDMRQRYQYWYGTLGSATYLLDYKGERVRKLTDKEMATLGIKP